MLRGHFTTSPQPSPGRGFAQKVGAVGDGTCVSLSYPRKRVSRWGGGFPARWIPAFAGMTSGGRLELLCKAPGRRESKRVPSPLETVDFLRGGPSIRPRKKWGLLGANGFSNLFREYLNRSPRVAAFFWRRIEGRAFLSTLSFAGMTNRSQTSDLRLGDVLPGKLPNATGSSETFARKALPQRG